MMSNQYLDLYVEDDEPDLALLKEEGLIVLEYGKEGLYDTYPTDKGVAYYRFNPKLKNPTVWDDKKYIITTSISVLALAISVLSLYFSIC